MACLGASMRPVDMCMRIGYSVALVYRLIGVIHERHFGGAMKDKKIDEAKEKLLEINALVKQLDESMRASALEVLIPIFFSTTEKLAKETIVSPQNEKSSAGTATVDTGDLGEFIALFDTKTPADNVMLLVAWLYSHYGLYVISTKEITELGDSCGLIIPSRPDNTMRQAKKDGKTLFQQQGKGWRLTVSGEMCLKNQYTVKKGNKPLPKE